MAGGQALQLALLCVTLLLAHGRAPLFIDKVNHVVSSYRLARDLIDSRWNDTWSAELPCAAPRVNGFVSKIATGAQSPTLGMTIAEAEQFTFERLPIYSGCQVSSHVLSRLRLRDKFCSKFESRPHVFPCESSSHSICSSTPVFICFDFGRTRPLGRVLSAFEKTCCCMLQR